jgi:hypothetical protein
MSDSAVEEKELIQFDQADVFLKVLLSDDFYPGGLAKEKQIQVPEKEPKDDRDRQRTAKGEESMRKLTSIVSGFTLQSLTLFISLTRSISSSMNTRSSRISSTRIWKPS